MMFSSLAALLLIQLAVSKVIPCDYVGARCVDSSGTYVVESCTKYYALCTECGIQTAPIPLTNPLTQSCLNGVIVSASTCASPHTCNYEGIQCTDAQGTAVSGSCSSFYMECINGILSDVRPVAAGSKCLNNEFVLNSVCTSAQCTFTGIQCTNGAGEFVNTFCTGYFVECNDGVISQPMLVPAGSQCYQNNLVIEGTCTSPICNFEGIRCSDATGGIVSNTCTSYYVECDNGFYTKAMPVAAGTQCYNDEIVNKETCSGVECTEEQSIVCSDVNGVIHKEKCTGYFRQCVDGTYSQPEIVPTGTRCKKGVIVLPETCDETCTTGTRRCTDSIGNFVVSQCTEFYKTCVDGHYNTPVEETAPGTSCYNGNLIATTECFPTPYECDFTGIRCSTDDGDLVSNTCTNYYVQCDNGYYTAPRETATGTRCFNNEQVLASSCSATCSFPGTKCSTYDGVIVNDRCTNYFVECDNGLQTAPMPVAAGAKCLNGVQVNANTCNTPICTEDELICVDENDVIQPTECTDFFRVCDNGMYVTKQPVAYGTKCMKRQIVPATNCTGVGCLFDGIKCSDANGIIYEEECTAYYVQCADGQITAPHVVAAGTRCYDGLIVKTETCAYQDCDFTGIKCSDANGVVSYTHCMDYFLECAEDRLAQPMPVADGTKCFKNAIIASSKCLDAQCDFDGVKCSDADGEIRYDTCTSYFVQCDNGVPTAARPVADGTKCYNGEQIPATQCGSAQCSFEGFICVDANGAEYPDTCTYYYSECDNGKLTPPLPVADGTRCLSGTMVMPDHCTGVHCNFEGVRCVDANGDIVVGKCTGYYTQCEDGMLLPPRPVAEGTRCLNNEQVSAEICEGAQCDFKGIVCSDSNGVINTETCTSYYLECDNGQYTAPRPVADGTRCYKGKQVNANQCTGTKCTESQIVCSDANGVQYVDTCTSYFVECSNGIFSAPRPVAAGTRCRNGEQITAELCTGVGCDSGSIRCSDINGVINDNTCTDHFVECSNGFFSQPMPVADGTRCLKGELVLPFNCSSNVCDFTGIKCTDAAGTIFDTTCTNYFIECANGFYTNPMTVAAGTKCYGGKQVLASTCPGATCTYEGIKCSSTDGTIISGSCTHHYVECVDGAQSKPMPVPTGSRCLDEKIVLEAVCNQPKCVFTGIQCVTQTGVPVSNTCSSYYEKCVNGVLVGPVEVLMGTQCLKNEIVEVQRCPGSECDFDDFICSDKDGKKMTDVCTGYFVECENGKQTKPIPVAMGTKCYNQEIVPCNSVQCKTPETCEFEGIECSTSDGKVVYDHCTNFYVMCSNGKVTPPRATATGTKCYNGEQILSSQCESTECSFTGIICVNPAGDFVMDTCTTSYAKCAKGVQTIEKTKGDKVCYNSHFIDDESSQCRVTVEVKESKVKGIRGKK